MPSRSHSHLPKKYKASPPSVRIMSNSTNFTRCRVSEQRTKKEREGKKVSLHSDQRPSMRLQHGHYIDTLKVQLISPGVRSLYAPTMKERRDRMCRAPMSERRGPFFRGFPPLTLSLTTTSKTCEETLSFASCQFLKRKFRSPFL